MSYYNFTLIVEGDVELYINELFEAGCNDATFGRVNGVQYGKFDCGAASFAAAISSAIANVESVESLVVRGEVESGIECVGIPKAIPEYRG